MTKFLFASLLLAMRVSFVFTAEEGSLTCSSTESSAGDNCIPAGAHNPTERTMTEDQLFAYNGSVPERPILLAYRFVRDEAIRTLTTEMKTVKTNLRVMCGPIGTYVPIHPMAYFLSNQGSSLRRVLRVYNLRPGRQLCGTRSRSSFE